MSVIKDIESGKLHVLVFDMESGSSRQSVEEKGAVDELLRLAKVGDRFEKAIYELLSNGICPDELLIKTKKRCTDDGSCCEECWELALAEGRVRSERV